MKLSRRVMVGFLVLLILILPLLAGCVGQNNQPNFYNGGNADFSPSGAHFNQYVLFCFDTGASDHTLTLPSAADIVSSLQSPYAGEVVSLAIAADGSHSVKLACGANVTVKPSAATVPALPKRRASQIFRFILHLLISPEPRSPDNKKPTAPCPRGSDRLDECALDHVLGRSARQNRT